MMDHSLLLLVYVPHILCCVFVNSFLDFPCHQSLYLFTFLTTLLLLLAVSCGIVLRSFILRRRFRRRVEAAIAAGVLLPEQVDALRRRGPILGEKPKLYEVHIEGGHKEGYEPSSPVIFDHEDWSNIMVCQPLRVPAQLPGFPLTSLTD